MTLLNINETEDKYRQWKIHQIKMKQALFRLGNQLKIKFKKSKTTKNKQTNENKTRKDNSDIRGQIMSNIMLENVFISR